MNDSCNHKRCGFLGNLSHADSFSQQTKNSILIDLRMFPKALELALLNLNEDQLHIPANQAGYSIHEIVHHVADSHMMEFLFCQQMLFGNSRLMDFGKLPFDCIFEGKENTPFNISMTLLHALHVRWVDLLETVTPKQWEQPVLIAGSAQPYTMFDWLHTFVKHGFYHRDEIASFRNNQLI